MFSLPTSTVITAGILDESTKDGTDKEVKQLLGDSRAIRNLITWGWSHKIGKDLKEDNIKEMDISEKRNTIERKKLYYNFICAC